VRGKGNEVGGSFPDSTSAFEERKKYHNGVDVGAT